MSNTVNTGNLLIDVAATFKALYGYIPAQMPAAQPANPYYVEPNVNTRIAGQGLAPLTGLSDMLGRPVFMPITLNAINASTGIKTPYNFPFSMLSLKSKKIIKETPMVERGGSVIEEVGISPWEIEMKGFLIDAEDQFPDDQLSSLFKLYTANQADKNIFSVELKCALSDIFLIPNVNVVITEIEIPAKAKVIGVRDFTMKMIQDSVLNLYPVVAVSLIATTNTSTTINNQGITNQS
jgi:hypothetical protein